MLLQTLKGFSQREGDYPRYFKLLYKTYIM